jgi:iron complex transport system permease protein
MHITVAYKQFIRRKQWLLGLLLVVLFLAVLLSIRTGSLGISWSNTVQGLLSRADDSRVGHVIWQIRLPRTLAAVMAGAGLAVAGLVMQTVLKNPLASPFTIGVSQGAACGAAFAIIILGAGTAHRAGTDAVSVCSPHLVVACAFAGAMLAVFLILLLAAARRITPESVILAGVALSAFFGATTMLLQYFADDLQVAATVFWTFGDLGKAGWPANAAIAAAAILPLLWFIAGRWHYNALSCGDEVAASLGVKVRRLRITAMVLAAISVAVATAFLGIIGFIGLIAPHLMRLVIGHDHRHLLPATAIFGGLLLLISDVLARSVLAPVILPVGIITSMAGAPLFVYLLVRGRDS